MPNYPYMSNIPAAGNNPSNDQPNMQINTNSISSILNVDLYGFENTNGGTHQQVTFPTASPGSYSPSGDAGVLYVADDLAAHAQLFFKNALNTFQLTGASLGGTPSSGYAWVGGLLIQWGSGSMSTQNQTFNFSSFGIAFPNNCFSIVVTGGNNGNVPRYYGVNSLSKTSFQIYAQPGTGNFYFIAVGN